MSQKLKINRLVSCSNLTNLINFDINKSNSKVYTKIMGLLPDDEFKPKHVMNRITIHNTRGKVFLWFLHNILISILYVNINIMVCVNYLYIYIQFLYFFNILIFIS